MITMSPGKSPSSSRSHIHFARGQFGLYIEHDRALKIDDILENIRKAELFSTEDRIHLTANRVVSFSALDQGRTLSFVFATSSNPGLQDEFTFLGFLAQLNEKIQARSWPPDFTLVQALPNWLSGGAPEPDGSGGPGGRPVAPDQASLTEFSPGSIPLPGGMNLNDISLDRCGECVDVFILDTAPCDVDLKRAYTRWVEEPEAAGKAQHVLLKQLIGPVGALGHIHGDLRVEYAGFSHLLEVATAFLPDHDYVMSDHGLFVASVVNRFAPAARLHLIEVLNPYGVGTLESITNGFKRAAEFAEQNPGTKVLVNASLFFSVPPSSAALTALAGTDEFWQLVLEQHPHLIQASLAPFEVICSLFEPMGAKIIAAAGNDGTGAIDPATGKEKHPEARFPAAYSSVVGVAALDFLGNDASYSNLADLPVSDGVAVFGGDKVGDSADPAHGILGVYIGSFPDGTPNELGLARWAGTSFSAPIITAAFAALMCGSMSVQQVSTYIHEHAAAFRSTPTPSQAD